jgi:membrane-associated phospholipid phosphatase
VKTGRRSQLWARVIAVAALTGFAVLTLLVVDGATMGVDAAARDAFRPGDVWGTRQERADVIVVGLEPGRSVPAFIVLSFVLSRLRRSWGTLIFACMLLAAAGVPALMIKRALERTDPHHDLSSLGSYPSGHVLALLVCLGGALLLLRRRPRWWEWVLVGLPVATMGTSMLLQAAHWVTDLAGGILLGVAVLASFSGLAPVRSPRPPTVGTGRQGHPRSASARPS